MKVGMAVRSDVGRIRESNEDVGLVARSADPEAGTLLAVADGMGGHPAGEVASRIAIDFSARYPRQAPALLAEEPGDPETALVELLRTLVGQASEAILAESEEDSSRHGLGCTLVAGLVVGRRLHVLHCGDSRAYRLRGEMLDQLTADHVVIERGIRYLGLHLGMQEGMTLDHAAYDLEPGDRLLLCSDGLTDMVAPEDFGLVLHEAKSPEEACIDLVDLAIRGGGVDNITVAVAFLAQGEVEYGEPLVVRTDSSPEASMHAHP